MKYITFSPLDNYRKEIIVKGTKEELIYAVKYFEPKASYYCTYYEPGLCVNLDSFDYTKIY